MGVLMVQFKVGQDKEKSLVKLYDRVLGQRDRLPAGAGEPLVRSVDVDDVPIVTVTLASERYDDYALKRLADRPMEGLRSLETVSTISVKGGRDREMRIELDPQRLQSFGVTLDQVRATLGAGNVAAPLGTVVQQGQNRQMFLDGFLASAEDLERLIVGSHAGRPIYLGDVAQVVDGPPEERNRVSRLAFGPADGRFGKTQQAEIPAVTLAVAKKAGSNAVFVANDALDRIARMKAQFVPAGVDLIVTRNDGQKADAAVSGLIEHLDIAILAVFLVTAALLGLKEALIVGVTVPLILALTLGAAYLSGLTDLMLYWSSQVFRRCGRRSTIHRRRLRRHPGPCRAMPGIAASGTCMPPLSPAGHRAAPWSRPVRSACPARPGAPKSPRACRPRSAPPGR